MTVGTMSTGPVSYIYIYLEKKTKKHRLTQRLRDNGGVVF